MAVEGLATQRDLRRFAERCRAAGLKVTPQRLEVFREVAATTVHPDVETVVAGVRRRLPTVSVDTVYRALHTLTRIGVIAEMSTVGNRSRFDGNPAGHHHFLCTRCGSVQDFYQPSPADLPVPAEVAQLGEVRGVELQVRGICRECLDRASNTAGESDSVS